MIIYLSSCSWPQCDKLSTPSTKESLSLSLMEVMYKYLSARHEIRICWNTWHNFSKYDSKWKHVSLFRRETRERERKRVGWKRKAGEKHSNEHEAQTISRTTTVTRQLPVPHTPVRANIQEPSSRGCRPLLYSYAWSKRRKEQITVMLHIQYLPYAQSKCANTHTCVYIQFFQNRVHAMFEYKIPVRKFRVRTSTKSLLHVSSLSEYYVPTRALT